MSYDILLYPRTPGQTWEEVVAADEEEPSDGVLDDEVALAAGTATFRRIEARLRELLPEELETWVAEETGGDVYGELSAPSTGLQVELFARSAAVSFPYWDHEDVPSLHEQVRQAVAVVAEETGYQAYDPQTGETFDGSIDDERGREAARQLDAEQGATGHGAAGQGDMSVGDPRQDTVAGGAVDPLSGAVVAGQDADARPAVVDPRRDPAFLRRRGIVYLVLGVLLLAFGLWRLEAVGSNWLTILVVGIGIMDLLGGLLMLSLARQAASAQADPTR